MRRNHLKNQRPQRDRRMTIKYFDFDMRSDIEVTKEGELVHFALLGGVEPISYEEALQEHIWKNAMLEELIFIERNNIWELVDLPNKKSVIDVK